MRASRSVGCCVNSLFRSRKKIRAQKRDQDCQQPTTSHRPKLVITEATLRHHVGRCAKFQATEAHGFLLALLDAVRALLPCLQASFTCGATKLLLPGTQSPRNWDHYRNVWSISR